MDEKNEVFSYTYSASRQEEIKRIREKYAPPAEEKDRMERLRRLDRGVTRPGTIISVIIGVISALVFGVGMCCTMVWAETMFVPGIVIGIAGIADMISACPVFNHITKNSGKRWLLKSFV